MYNLPYYKAHNQKEVFEFMQQHSFVTLCGCDANNRPVASHVPVLMEEREGKLFLLGHVMKQTDHEKAFRSNHNVLAIFTGAHTYVSASWYTNPQQASTWNYQTVHAKGVLNFGDKGMLIDILTRLTAHHENNENSPSLMKDLPEEYVQRLVKAIVGFEIEVTAIDHVFKLSQDRDKESYSNIIQKLNESNTDARTVAGIMEKRLQS